MACFNERKDRGSEINKKNVCRRKERKENTEKEEVGCD